ncbi:hypothetical protein [Clostridium sp.]|jgi:hypothetical protein|uniref:hypothetical protein n=1 Tax=Clostridium sp. TaxID=1506 RepID=UPI003EE9F897
MKLLEIFYPLAGIVYLIYSVLCRNKVTYFSRAYYRTSEMKFIKLNEFLGLQLKFSIFKSIYLILYGILMIRFNLNNVFFIAGLLPFHLIDLVLIIRSRNMGYIDYKIGETYK